MPRKKTTKKPIKAKRTREPRGKKMVEETKQEAWEGLSKKMRRKRRGELLGA